ncbi:hypothetical protein AB1Y20_020229 [Prymnesium parvum]|uniref:Tyrosine-protein kinase ephrin type A/B receptor-like domain-containing protein n=1 Tax=Prymnesium parvum TaxID=97485 RepID=A0AB34IET7_PRYPA
MAPPGASAPPPLFPLFSENASAVAPRTLCQVCLAGHKCHRGSLSPQICSPGSFALAGHPETECTPCAAGYFQDAPGASQCKPCAHGLFCPPGSANPIGCESGAGIPYAQTTVALARSSSSCVCKAGYYDSGSTSEGGALACQSCPAGTSCNNPGATLVKLPLQAGYFRLHNQSIDVRKCPDSGANCSNVPVCAMSTSGCVGSANENGSEAAASGCNDGLEGVFCLLCTLNNGSRVYYSPASNSARAQCKECGNLVLEHILIAGGIIMLFVLLVPCAQHIHRIRMAKSSIDFRILVKLKILIGFSLIISVIDDVYEVDLPPDAKWLLTFYQAVVSIGFDVNIDVVLQDRRLQAIVECSAPHLLTLFFIASPLVTRVAFSAFSCYAFEESAWLKVDVAIQCHTAEHHVAQLLALVAIVVYPVGLMLVNGTLLLFTVNALITGKPHDAAADLVCHLGVPDPFGLVVNGVHKIAAEVARFMDTMSRLPDDSLESVTLLNMAHPNSIGINLLRQSALEVEDWFDYVMHQNTSEKTFYNGVRDRGRGTVGLDFFVNHEVARQAQLDAAHVVALRLYTTHIFKFINGPLRSTMYGNGKLPHPLPVTVMFISEGIKKLRSVYALR